MAQPLLAPNPYNDTTAGTPWSPGYRGPQTTTRQVGYGQPVTTTPPPRPTFAQTNGGPVLLPDNFTQDDVNQYIQGYNAYIAKLDQSIEAANGFEKLKFQAQRDDAQKALDNAYKIAQLQGDNSRYGVDAQRQTAIQDLAEKSREYDSTHGLDVANSYAKFASSPDAIWSLADFKDALGNVGQGGGPTPIGAQAAPHAKTYGDFTALQNYGSGQGPMPTFMNPDGSPANTLGQGGAATPSSAGGPSGASLSTGQGATGAPPSSSPPDLRIKAANAIMQAIPPSATPGHDSQDWAAIGAIKNLYFSGQPGAIARLGAVRTQEAQGGLARAGYNPALVQEDYDRAQPGQGSARAA